MAIYPQFYRCAYFPAHLHRFYRNLTTSPSRPSLLEALCSFAFLSVHGTTLQPSADSFAESIGAILHNMIVRGITTHPSLDLELAVSEQAGLPYELERKVSGDGSLRPALLAANDWDSEGWERAVENAMLFLRPLEDVKTLWSDDEASLFRIVVPGEADFVQAFIQEFGPLLAGMLHPQCTLSQLVTDKDANRFVDQRVDFAIEGEDLRIVVEIDDETHLQENQQRLDRARDEALHKAGWETFRLPNQHDELAGRIRSSGLFARAEETARSWDTPVARAARMLVGGLLNAARIQWAIARAVHHRALPLDAPEWRIGIREDETTVARPAIRDILRIMTSVVSLHHSWIPPRVTLFLPEDSCGEGDDNIEVFRLEDAEPNSLDLYIDIDSRIGPACNYPEPASTDRLLRKRGAAYVLRGSPVALGERRFLAAPSITYELSEGYQESLTVLLQTLFRKEAFREGQLDIITRILRRQDVVALLPTGAGKSLCYQLAGLMQPGLTVVVDPLVSLMKDQSDNLRDSGIDGVDHLSSARTAVEKRAIVERMAGGAYRFIFVSPERFQIRGFRDALRDCVGQTPVSHIVLDEVHCVSEWGHDFRTSYLRIAQVARRCTEGSDGVPPVVGLTATASIYVLKDIKRELALESEDSIIHPKELDRKELAFIPIKVEGDAGRQEALQRILQKLPERFGGRASRFYDLQGEETNSGLVFCIHVSNTPYSVFGLLPAVQGSVGEAPVEWFTGSMPGGFGGDRQSFDEDKSRNQTLFKDNEAVALVSTKAFGMGIDKPNIRWIIHHHTPGSLEAYYQEAGRAGRDRRPSLCFVMYSDGRYYESITPYLDIESSDRFLGKFKDLQEEYRSLSRGPRGIDGGDVYRNLFFLLQGFPGVDTETFYARGVYIHFLTPVMSRSGPGEIKNVVISFGALRKYMMKVKESRISTDTSKMRVERAIYRFSLLGIVTDYTTDWKSEEFTVSVQNLDDSQIVNNLREYIQRYDKPYYDKTIAPFLAKEDGRSLCDRSMQALIQFVYDTIVAQRIRALRGVTNAIRQSFLDGADEAEQSDLFRRRILDYLNQSEFSDMIAEVVDTEDWDPEQWFGVLEQLNSENAGQLVGGCQRALESRAEHPGLLFLSALGIWVAPQQYSIEEGIRDFRSALVLLHQSNAYSEMFYELAEQMIGSVQARCEPPVHDAACQVLLEAVPDRETVDFVLNRLSDVRFSAFWQAINMRTQPLVDRLHRTVAHHST